MEIDSLNLQISASASKAITALDGLTKSLEEMGVTLAPVALGLEKVTQSLNSIIGYSGGMSTLAKAFEDLSTSWTGLMSATKKSSNTMVEASTKAKTMADSIAKEFGIKGKENVLALQTAIENMYNSIGDNVGIGKALSNIETLIRQYSSFKAATDENAVALRKFLNEHNLQLDEAIKKRKDLINIMGKIGPRNISETGALPSDFVKEYNFKRSGELYDPDRDYSKGMIDISGMTDESEILDKIILHLQGAKQETLNFAQVTSNSNMYVEQFGDVLGRLNDLLGNLAATAGTTVDGAFGAFREAFIQINAVSPETAKNLLQIDSAVEGLTNTADINPFAGVIEGLAGLQDINLSDSLANLAHIRDAVGKLGGKYSNAAAENLTNIAAALRQWNGVQIPNYGGLAYLASALGEFGKKKLTDGFDNLIKLKVALADFANFHIDESVSLSVSQLADAMYKFGLTKVQKATTNLPALASGLRQLISSLSTMPQVSENTIRLVTALGNLNVSGTQLNRAMNNLGGGLKRYRGHALNAHKASMSLAQAFGKMYANFFIFFRLINRFKKDIDLASQLKEVQNVVDVTFGDMAYKMNDFGKTSIETLGMSELTAKQIGSKYQAMGKAMGISTAMAKSTNDFVQKATKGYADVAEGMADISLNLTKLAGDMASFYNKDYEEVAEKLQAVFTGQTRPLRAFGLDLTQATLAEFAMKNGMEANMKTMTQAEKTLLRYQYVMAQTTAAHGDFIRTQDTWANQIRIATEKLNQLRIVLGKIAIYTFKPLVKSFNAAMSEILKGAEGLLNALGKIFGWKIEWSDAGVLQDEADDAEDLANGMGDAADNAKKFKNFLLGIDELNLLPDKNDDDKNKSGGVGGIGGNLDDLGDLKIKPVENAFESLYDTLYKLGKRIAEVEKQLLKGIDWDKAYKNARKFGKGFASFLNGYLSDVELFYHKGRALANGINTVAHAIDAFFKEFDGRQFGLDRAMQLNGFTSNLDWSVIKSAAYEMAHDLAEYINGFVENVNWRDVGRTIIEGVNTAVLFASTTVNEVDWAKMGNALGEAVNGLFENWDEEETARLFKGAIKGALDLANNFLTKTDFELLGSKIGHFFAELDLSQFAEPLADLFLNLLKASFNVLSTMSLEAPLESALITAFAASKFLGVGGLLGTSITSALKGSLVSNMGTVAADGAVRKSAGGLGTAIAELVVTAFIGYGVGDKIGQYLANQDWSITKGDQMWYGKSFTQNAKEISENKDYLKSALKELTTDLFTWKNEVDDADRVYLAFSKNVRGEAAEMLTDIQSDYADFDVATSKLLETAGTSWGQIKDNLRMGKVELGDEDFERLQEMLTESGASISEIVPLINQLKDAQNEYYNGFSEFYEKEGQLYESREKAYQNYSKIHTAVDEFVKGHERERKALEAGVITYEDVYNRIPKIVDESTQRASKASAKNLGVFEEWTNGITKRIEGVAIKNADVIKKGVKNTAEDVEKDTERVERASTKGGKSFNIITYAMTDLRDKSTLAMSGVIDLNDKLSSIAQSEVGVKNMSTDFVALNTNIANVNTALVPVKNGILEFAVQTQANMLNVANSFGHAFSNIMKAGNQTIAWLKSSFVPYFSGAYWQTITSSIPNSFGNAFRQATNIMVNIWKQFAEWANANMKINVNANGKKQSEIKVEVPTYSTGGFPEDGFFYSNHSELVGKFSNGKTAVANNEQIVEGIKQGVYEAMASAMANNGSGSNVTVELHGDASDIFTAVVKENNRAIYRTGSSPIRN